jgi:hypothetical protein
MATNSTNPNDLYDVNTPDINGILGAVLGKEVNQNTTSAQNTDATTDSNATSSQNVVGTQTQASTASTDTQNTGTQRTTGTVQHSSDTSQTGQQVTKGDADTAALREVYAKQAGGITPEMLDAIFTQGAKAAPQLVVANANALGARAGNNTPVAAALQQLHLDLTSKAADINRQMLADSGNTAGKIADVTRSSVSDTSQQTSATGQDVQDLLTATDSKSIAQQISNTINNTQQQTTGQNQAHATQTQATTATEQKNAQTTINTSVAKTLLGAFVGGVALDQLFRQATGHGFVGTMADLAKQLIQNGANPDQVNQQLVDAGLPPYDYQPDAPPDVPIPDVNYDPNYGDPYIPGFADGGSPGFLPIQPLIKKPLTIPGNEDADLAGMLSSLGGGGGGGMSSGGRDPGATGGETGSGGGGTGTQSSGITDANGLSPSDPGYIGSGHGYSVGPSLGDAARVGQNLAGIAASIASGNIAGVIGNLMGLVSTATRGQNISQMTEATISNPVGYSAAPLDTTPQAPTDVMSLQDTPDIAGLMGDLGMSAGNGPGGADGQAGDAGASDAGSTGAGSDTGSDAGQGGDGTGSGGQLADGGYVVEPKVGTKGPVRKETGGGGMSPEAVREQLRKLQPQTPVAASAPEGRTYNGLSFNTNRALRAEGEYADGGEVEESESQAMESNEPANEDVEDDHNYLLNALGITRATGDGSLTFSPQAVKMLHRAVSRGGPTASGKPPGMANGGAMRQPAGYNSGGKIQGPGTGTSDSIPAVTNNGAPLRVANGEYVIPADVVQKFGTQAFDKLVAQHHIPADMQRAITGEG